MTQVRGGSAAETFQRLEPVLEALELGPDLDRFVAGYSLGMKKKLALLVAMLDEPTNGLDPPSAVKHVSNCRRSRAPA